MIRELMMKRNLLRRCLSVRPLVWLKFVCSKQMILLDHRHVADAGKGITWHVKQCSEHIHIYTLLSSLWVSHTGSASDWCALQEALCKCIDTIQYNTYLFSIPPPSQDCSFLPFVG